MATLNSRQLLIEQSLGCVLVAKHSRRHFESGDSGVREDMAPVEFAG